MPRGCAELRNRTGGGRVFVLRAAAAASCAEAAAVDERKSDQGGGNRTQHGELFYNVFARIELNAKSNNDW